MAYTHLRRKSNGAAKEDSRIIRLTVAAKLPYRSHPHPALKGSLLLGYALERAKFAETLSLPGLFLPPGYVLSLQCLLLI